MYGARAISGEEKSFPSEARYVYVGVGGVRFADLLPHHGRSSSMPPLQIMRLAVATLLIVSPSCSLFHRDSSAPAPAAVRVARPSDAEITGILLTANNTDISYAQLVSIRAQTQAVRDFAARLLTDHTVMNARVSELLSSADITPRESGTSLDLRDESAMKRDVMRELSGRAFDTTYIANEINFHTRLLASIDVTLLPAARNGQLRQLITGMRPAVAEHLTQAQQLRASLPR